MRVSKKSYFFYRLRDLDIFCWTMATPTFISSNSVTAPTKKFVRIMNFDSNKNIARYFGKNNRKYLKVKNGFNNYKLNI